MKNAADAGNMKERQVICKYGMDGKDGMVWISGMVKSV